MLLKGQNLQNSMNKDWKKIYLLGFITLVLTVLCCLCFLLPACTVNSINKTDDGLVGISFSYVINGPSAIFGGATFPVIGEDLYFKEHILMATNSFDVFTFLGYILVLCGGVLSLISYKRAILRNVCKALLLVGSIVVFCEPIFFYVCANLNDTTYFSFNQTSVYQNIGPIASFILGLAALIIYCISNKLIYLKGLEVEDDE